MNCEIISVGTEILLGDIVNTHAQYLSRELSVFGINILYHTSVGDNPQRLQEVFLAAYNRSDFILLTGGLGPTNDDITKEVVSEALQLDLVYDETALQKIKDFFKARGIPMPENNLKQALVPKGAEVFQNNNGTAPGLAIEGNGKCVLLLPGPPNELNPMFEESVIPFLKKHFNGAIVSHNIMVVGIGESIAASQLGSLTEGENPSVALYAKTGEVIVRVTAKASSEEKANAMIFPVIYEIQQILQGHIYGIDVPNLETAVVHRLMDEEKKIAVAESCTGGLLSQKLTSVPGASCVLDYAVTTYANEVKSRELYIAEKLIKDFGAVSEPVALAMAEGVLERGRADIGIGITGIAGPDGGTDAKPVGTVYIALATKKYVWVKHLTLAPKELRSREYIRNMATIHALDMIREFLTKNPEMIEGLVTLKEKKAKTKVKLRTRLRNLFPRKGDSFGEVIRKFLFLIAFLVALGSAIYLVNYYLEEWRIGQTYSGVSQLLGEETGKDDRGILNKLLKLYEENNDLVGYIEIPDTNISYPVVQAEDNDFYLYRDFYKNDSKLGAPFMDFRNVVEQDDYSTNLIIYAHHARSGKFFADLKNYRNVDFYKEHPIVNFDTLYEEGQWKIFSVFITNTEESHGAIFDYNNFIEPENESHFNWYVEELKRRSIIDSGVDVEYGDKMLLLSTCTYEFDNARLVVVARRVREGEEATIDQSAVKANSKVLYPDIWYTKKGGSKPSYEPNTWISNEGEEFNTVTRK